MLDADTRRRIDTARDILVGKVPDPKSQVEQITIALIYKFMDDMDAESEEFGGVRKFFAGEFARYGWARLMHAGLGGFETLNLYAEAITKMPENPGIPPLFRNIFKNAYLPYRDPETLKMFLKVIDEFSYDHSERLGDAFEYLLSVLGSQGDAGQFRTPRHIIDFMVAVVDPKKTETVLDPACGTAGFLISSYKHILRANTDADGHSTLTPDERGRLAQNFHGYDISPDMVRLSLVNLYLHGFADPHIFEYDTLTSQERWHEYADVILANPPFMSPKGGIKPHNRFSVQSKRSEVLFVDYMAEHLTPTGRAAIIVPEGIIFQSQNAYRDLRKMLVDTALVAVVSLPAGVFNPYSGVKTSILILDKALAKRADAIAFFKVENDGFSLGAQRREIDKNDLPAVLAAITNYKLGITKDVDVLAEEFVIRNSQFVIVPKAKIAANREYNLSGERYREGGLRTSSYPLIAIQEVAEVASGFGFPLDQQGKADQDIPFLKVSDMNLPGNEMQITSWNNTVSRETLRQLGAKSFPKGTVIFPKIGAAIATNKKRILSRESTYDNNVMGIIPGERIMSEYLYALLQSTDLSIWASDSQPPSMRKTVVEAHKIPLPPLDVQQAIVAEIEGYQKVINGARAVLDNYRPHIPIQPDWPMVLLGNVCETFITGPFGSTLHQSDYVENGTPVINPQNIIDGTIVKDVRKSVSSETLARLKEFTVRENDIVIGRRGEMGRCAVVPAEMSGWLCGSGSFVIRLKPECHPRFVHLQISSPQAKAFLEAHAVGVTLKNLNQDIVSALEIPLPPLATQQAIVAEIEAEQALVAANRELTARFERKIQAALARVWGGGLP